MKTPVNIETNKGASTISNYRGLISSEDLSAILAGKMRKPFVKVESVYWTEQAWSEKKKCIEHCIVRLGVTPPYEHHHTTVWLRPEHISVIMQMEQHDASQRTAATTVASKRKARKRMKS